ncbi:nucleotide sugar dehydrogenase [Candidatus Pelagibacter sp.]|nr:nucleotide sugar dehydrogenase [Candidatus Pelagibacter sp.]
MSKINYIKIPKNCTINDLLNLFNFHLKTENFSNLAIKFNKKNKIEGIISLGDLRRIIIKKKKNLKIDKFLNRSPTLISENDLNNKLNTLIDKKLKIKNKKIDQLIIINKSKNIVDIKEINNIRNNLNYKEITVIGLGHIGLPLSVHFLKNFSHVNGYDKDQGKINSLKNLKLNFYEKNLENPLKRAIKSKKLILSNKLNQLNSQIYIICIGSDIENNKISNYNLITIVKQVAKKISQNDLIVMRGTVQVGVCRNLVVPILEKYSKLKCGVDFFFSYLPERIIEGDAMHELENISQIVSGYSKNCKEKAVEFCSKAFKSLIELNSIEEGEIIKLASNSYRDLSFAFANDVSRISSYYGLSGNDLINKANFGYPRNLIAKPSMGVGGFCLPKDPILFSKLFKSNKNGYSLGENSRNINQDSIKIVFNKIKKFSNKFFKNKKINIFIFGITFKGKPETIDIRNSPSIIVAKKLKKLNFKVKFYDAMYKELKKNKFDFSESLTNNYKKINQADVIIIANNHELYPKMIEYNLKQNMSSKKKLIFDCWSLLDKQMIENLNWHYKNI